MTILLIIVGCSPSISTSEPVNILPTNTEMPIENTQAPVLPASTATLTFTPTIHPTETVIPTFTTQCPETNNSLVANFDELFNQDAMSSDIMRDIEHPVLDFLNQGGAPDKVINAFAKGFNEDEPRSFLKDVTNDSVPELFIDDFLLHVLGCQNGKYALLLKIKPVGAMPHSQIFLIQDMNLDGIPDLVISEWTGDNLYVPDTYRIMEWDGVGFKDLIIQPKFESRYGAGNSNEGRVWIDGVWGKNDEKQVEIIDIDNNGTFELILRGGLPVHPDARAHGPWRAETDIYIWNGKGFVIYSVEPAAPRYRFQAVQDADYALFDEDYTEALNLYNNVIVDKNLEWWSTDRYLHESQVTQAEYLSLPTPPPLPPNNSEYKYLSAYARYRILTIYTNLGELSKAQNMYETIQKEYPDDQEGHVIAELATIFWNEYIISDNLYNACSNAISFAIPNAFEIFNYVGFVKTEKEYDWTYHGWQIERDYKIEDICPFK